MRAVSARSPFGRLTQPPLSGPVGAPPDGSHPATDGSPGHRADYDRCGRAVNGIRAGLARITTPYLRRV